MTETTLTRRALCRSLPVAAVGGVVGATSTTTTAQEETPGEVRWTYSTDDSFLDGPIVLEDGTAVAADSSGTVYAVDAADGSEIWTYDTGSETLGSPTVQDGVVVVANPGTASRVVGIDVTEGTERWTLDVGGDTVVSTAVDGTFLVGNEDGDLYAVTAETGEQEWHYERENPSRAFPTVADDAVLLSGRGFGTVEAVEIESGERRWGVDESVAIGATDVNDGAVFGWFERTVKALDLGTGDRRWEYGTEALVSTTQALGDGGVYFGDQSGAVHAVDASEGTGEWTQMTGERPLYRVSVSGDTVLTCDARGKLSALGTDGGDLQWSLGTEARRPLEWTATEEAVFVGSAGPAEDPRMYARGLADGSEGWTTSTDDAFWAAPALTEDTVVAASYGGTVYGFERGSVGSSGDGGGQGLPGFGIGAAVAGIGAGVAWYRRRGSGE